MTPAEATLTPLRAFRIALNLDSDKICAHADISRSYLTRLEQGAIPSVEIAERVVRAIKSGACSREKTQRRAEVLEPAEMFFSRLGGKLEAFSEMHLLYPERFQANKPEGDTSWSKNTAK